MEIIRKKLTQGQRKVWNFNLSEGNYKFGGGEVTEK